MATVVPAPVLDLRNGDQVVAQAIASMPAELSDRSNSNPAVVLTEAQGTFYDKIIFQLNRWPQLVIQKVLSLIGILLNPATAATVTQTFVLSAPSSADTVIPGPTSTSSGTQVANNTGSLIFSTLSDLTIPAYITGTGTLSLVSGSTAVVGAGTAFLTQAPAGYQISTDKITWYTVASVTNDTNLVLSSSAASTVGASSFYAGAISGTVQAQCTTTGVATNAAAGSLTSLQSSPAGVASTTNASAATGGADLESVTAAIARAGTAFAIRDVACSASDYAAFAQKILGTGSRAAAQANTNNTTAQAGYITIAGLSPAWTTSSSISAQERANIVRDASGRSFTGATIVDVAANVQQFTTSPTMPACLVYRSQSYDSASVRVNIAAKINTLLSPNTYPWGRTIYMDDLAKAIEAATGVDRVYSILGTLAVGTSWQQAGFSMTFTNGSASVTANAADVGHMKPYQTFIADSTNSAGYLVIAASGTSITLDRTFQGATVTSTPFFFHAQDAPLTNWYSVPYSALSIDSTAPSASILVVGSA